MKYGNRDASGDADPDADSTPTPLPGELNNEEKFDPLDPDEIKASVENLRILIAAMPPTQYVNDPNQEFTRPGVQEESEVDNHYERTGVSHLVHAWHSQAHKRPEVSELFFRHAVHLTSGLCRILLSLQWICVVDRIRL